ncbi:hypothetical protein [Salinibacterium sp. ZJ70]|uniref:hypothetical protein n=1 Tax=Salinibacterium sp. ZJ70 TaxID=2708084 RepID=UPI00142024B7|nr:hypothetical protein [Salinibacterium sp. ZJ70]
MSQQNPPVEPPRDETPAGAEGSGSSGSTLAVFLVFGIAIGAGFGAAIDNIAVGVGVGIAVGLALGAAFGRRAATADEPPADENDPPRR